MHEASGSFEHDPQRRAAREGEPEPTGPLGDPPDSLTALQREAWQEIAGNAAPGVLTNADRVLVEMYCRLAARMRGELTPDGYPNPLKAAEYSLLVTILGRMGMTPSDRARMKVPPAPGKRKAANTFDDLAGNSQRGSNVN